MGTSKAPPEAEPEGPGMEQERRPDAAAPRGESLARDVAILVLTGVALGIGFNAMGRAGKPPRGLSWIAEPVDPGKYETVVGGDAASEAVPASPKKPRFDVGDDPLGVAAAPAGSADLPEIPELARPRQMQLPMVKRFFDAGAALFVDSRDAPEYAEAHIPGAICMPFDETVTDPERIERLDPGGRPIIVYCGGGTCETSIQLAETLTAAGKRKVLFFMAGFPGWVEAGYPVARGAAPGAGVP